MAMFTPPASPSVDRQTYLSAFEAGLSAPTPLHDVVCRRVAIIANPTAGGYTTRRLEKSLGCMAEQGCEVRVLLTNARGDATRLAYETALSGTVDIVVAAGGDGTINEVANGLAQAGVDGIAMGILPMGTANVLAAEVGIEGGLLAAARVIATGKCRPLYLGLLSSASVDEPPFINRFVLQAGSGFDARVIEKVDLSMKRRFGRFAYVWSALKDISKYPFASSNVEIETPDGNIAYMSGVALLICNGRLYGGSYVAAPSNDISQPAFQVLALKKPGAFNLVRYSWGLWTGGISRFRDVQTMPATKVRIIGGNTRTYQLDGDPYRSVVSEIQVDQRPLSLIVPDSPNVDSDAPLGA